MSIPALGPAQETSRPVAGSPQRNDRSTNNHFARLVEVKRRTDGADVPDDAEPGTAQALEDTGGSDVDVARGAEGETILNVDPATRKSEGSLTGPAMRDEKTGSPVQRPSLSPNDILEDIESDGNMPNDWDTAVETALAVVAPTSRPTLDGKDQLGATDRDDGFGGQAVPRRIGKHVDVFALASKTPLIASRPQVDQSLPADVESEGGMRAEVFTLPKDRTEVAGAATLSRDSRLEVQNASLPAPSVQSVFGRVGQHAIQMVAIGRAEHAADSNSNVLPARVDGRSKRIEGEHLPKAILPGRQETVAPFAELFQRQQSSLGVGVTALATGWEPTVPASPAEDEAGMIPSIPTPAAATTESLIRTATSLTYTAPSAAVRQVLDAVVTADGDRIEIALSPEELGRVRITISHSETGLSLNLSADRQETMGLLRRHAEELARSLAEMGLGSADIAFSDGRSAKDDPRSHGGLTDDSMSDDPTAIPVPPPAPRRNATDGRMDLRY